MDNTICYLNTDLDLTSTQDLTALAAAFKTGGVFALHVTNCEDGLWRATFETDLQHTGPDANIAAMLDVLESLTPELRAVWESCTRREFNLGYDCGIDPWGFNQGLSPHSLGRIAAAEASIRVTIYPDREPKKRAQ